MDIDIEVGRIQRMFAETEKLEAAKQVNEKARIWREWRQIMHDGTQGGTFRPGCLCGRCVRAILEFRCPEDVCEKGKADGWWIPPSERHSHGAWTPPE